MSITQTNQFAKAWIVADAQANVDGFLSLPDRIVAETAVGSLGNVTVTLQGSPLGLQVQGDLATVRQELSTITDKSFNVATIVCVLREKGNAPLQITFNIAQRLLTVGIQNTDRSVSQIILDALMSVFPESVGISQAELASKTERLAALLREADALKATAVELKSEAKTLAELAVKAKLSAVEALASATDAGKAKQDALTQKGEAQTARTDAQKILGEITTVKTLIEGEQSATNKLSQGVTSMESRIRDFFTRVDEHSGKLKQAEVKTATIAKENSDLQAQIKEQLIKAVGAGLFGAFERRKGQLVTAKWIWAGLSVVATLIQVGVVVWLASEAKDLGANTEAVKMLSPIFLLKATASIPVFFLIGFCVTQYSHERRHEETYAFKTALSFSLAPYLDLVRQIPDHKDSDKYRDFFVSTIGQVFAEPNQDKGKNSTPTLKVLGEVEHLMDNIGQFVEKIRK
jgi:hypothetical protein